MPSRAPGRVFVIFLLAIVPNTIWNAAAQTPERQFAQLCAGCHGETATGTDRGPALVNNRSLRRRTEDQIHDLIRTGTTGGMPAFPLPEAQLRPLAKHIRAFNASAFDVQPDGDPDGGSRFFFGAGRCATCHMVRGRGGVNGPDLSNVGKELTLRDLGETLDNPTARLGVHSTAACPGWAFCPDESWRVVNVHLRNGKALRGFARSQGAHDLQLQTFDGRLQLLGDTEYDRVERETTAYMPALSASAAERRDLIAYLSRLGGVPVGALTSNVDTVPTAATNAILNPAPGEWPTYNGVVGGNRHSPLQQINTGNVAQMRLAWSWSNEYQVLETTPLVSEGILYLTAPNRVCALDGGTGRQIWCYVRPRNAGPNIAGDAAKGANRGSALLGDRIFFATDDAHLICINRLTGALMWDVDVREGKGAFGSTGAPLIAGDLVITGVAGGDGPLRGYISAYKATTGERVWRFWTVPKRGEPKSDTWIKSGKNDAIETGGGATWTTGSYDPALGLLYWPTGNPYPDTDGDERGGDNLYTDCVVALDAKTGQLRWHYQFTPHDLHDWDANEPFILTDAKFQGRDRKLLLQANRNGFFYVLDRVTGEFLLGKPFVRKLTWASGIGTDGRPVLLEGNQPGKRGTKTCPAVRGATNWYSTAFHQANRLFYVMAVEDCNIYQQTTSGGFEPYRDPKDPAEKFLRAIDFETGRIVWEVPQVGPPESNYSGALSTAGGLVFYGETGGSFAAVDAKSGKTLWHFNTGAQWKASPITYLVGNRQYVAVAAGGTVVAFAVPSQPSDPFKFAVIGDRTGSTEPGIHEQVWKSVAARQPAFVLGTGDLIEGGKDTTAAAEWLDWTKSMEPWKSIDFHTPPGNHDIWSASSESLFEKNLHHPRHYSFDAGPVHVTVLDNSRSDALPAEELKFATEDLQDHADAKVKIIVSHRPFWLFNAVLGNPDFPLHQLAKKYGVRYVIAGHVHAMMHAQLDGIDYISMPSSGGHLRASAKYEDGWFFGYAWVEVRDEKVEFKIRDLTGKETTLDAWGMGGLN